MTDPGFLIDSNIAIYILDGGPPPLRRAIESRATGEVVVSSISFAEVMRGIDPADEEREGRARQLFATFPVLPFDQAAAERYRAIPFRRGTFDRLIAAHALSLDLTLISNNVRDFANIPGLAVENWTLA